MKRLRILSLLLLVTLAFSCGNDDGDGISEEQRQFIMGDATGTNVISLGLTTPLVQNNDAVHISPRELDINFDQEADVLLRAFEEFGGFSKGLTLTTLNMETRVSVDENGDIKALSQGDIITATSETWVNADALPLAELMGQTTNGLWNGLQNRYVAVRIDIDNTRYLGWIELSVDSYDNYTFHNYAVKLIP